MKKYKKARRSIEEAIVLIVHNMLIRYMVPLTWYVGPAVVPTHAHFKHCCCNKRHISKHLLEAQYLPSA